MTPYPSASPGDHSRRPPITGPRVNGALSCTSCRPVPPASRSCSSMGGPRRGGPSTRVIPMLAGDAPGLRRGPSRIRRLQCDRRPSTTTTTAAGDLHPPGGTARPRPGPCPLPGHQRRTGIPLSPPRIPMTSSASPAIESTLAWLRAQSLADVTHGGSWHVGFLVRTRHPGPCFWPVTSANSWPTGPTHDDRR